MAIEILMPALSPTMTEGNLAKWLKKEGDKVKPGDVLAEIETDKATMEVEAVDAGTLGKIVIPAKTEGVKVNQLIAVLLEANEAKSAIDELLKKHQGGAAVAAPVKQEVAQKIEQPKVVNAPASVTQSSSRVFASPLAKRIAEQQGIDLSSVKGSGPHGRIVKEDVMSFKSAPSFANTNFSVGRSNEQYRLVPNSNMRKVIAKRLVESKQTVPHFYLTVDCQLDELLKVREQINAKAPKNGDKAAYKISVNDFVIKASAQALRAFPKANASWSDEGIMIYNNVDISIAVAIEDGLITPIVKNADQKSLAQISAEMKDLAARAKTNSLKPEEFQGGGFSISNLGMYGIKQFNAIINPPQACILAVGVGEEKPVVRNGKLEIATVMTVTMSCDHRVIDGALGAELIQAFKNFIEQPAMMLV
jgi:pyruvate dehydrogenase E2 component (dihydrolipoamide acetyltransferase)